MNLKSTICLLSWFCFSIGEHAQNFPDTYYELEYGKLKYGFYIPEGYNPSEKYPLVTYFHGWGNNYPVYLDWYNQDIQDQNPCFVFTPRTPPSWADWSGWWEDLSEPMQAAMHVLDSMLTVYSIDTNRLYVYGISMGGEGTFDLLDKLPRKFAAAMSVCGGGRAAWAENISQTPFWMFHGGADNVNPPSLTEDVYNELVNIGAKKMRYKMYPGYDHEIWNVAASEPSWHDWMFAHSKNDTACSIPNGQLELAGSISAERKIKLQWNDIRNPEIKSEKVWYYKIYNKDGLLGTVEFNKTEYGFNQYNMLDTFSVSAVNYHFKESNISNKIFYNNGEIITSLNDETNLIPETLELYDNYPNPFSSKATSTSGVKSMTTIKFSVGSSKQFAKQQNKNNNTTISSFNKSHHITLKVYDLLGRHISTLVNDYKLPGKYSVEFDASNLPGGIYIYVLKNQSLQISKKMLFVK